MRFKFGGTAGRTLYDPGTLALTGWYRNYTNPSWPGTASAGTSGSGSNDWNDPGNEPAQGTALNGYGTAAFNGADDFFSVEGTLDTYLAATAFSFWSLINLTSSAGWLWRDQAGTPYMGISFGSNLVTLGAGANLATTVTRATSNGSYMLVTGRYTGSNLQVGVNEVPGAAGGGSTTALASALTLTGTIRAGNFGVGWLNATVAEFGITDISLSDANFLDIKNNYINPRYALSL